LDTDHIRREKGVISMAFEVVVGTRDSQRGQAGVERAPSTAAESTTAAAQHSQYPASLTVATPEEGDGWSVDPSPMPHSHHSDSGIQDDYRYSQEGQWNEYDYAEDYTQPFQPMDSMVAPPEVEEPVDEKTRVRRHEEALLPSSPGEAGPSTSNEPSAPVMPDNDGPHDYQQLPSPGTERPPHDSTQTVVMNGSAAEPSDPAQPDDKREMERQRLMHEASAPDEETADGEASDAGPSAPTFDEDDQLVGGTAQADESLPVYQR
jgi:hypothetical protein